MSSYQKMISKLPCDLVDNLKMTEQNPKYHPEKTLYKHIWIVYDSILKSNIDDSLKQDLLICAIFHDLGKIDSTFLKERKNGEKVLVAYGHEIYAEKYLDRYLHLFLHLFNFNNLEMIYEVCSKHMRAHLFDKMSVVKQEKFQENKYFYETMEFSKFDNIGKNKVPDFIVTIGIPGSGKSQWANYFVDQYKIINPDQIRKEVTGDISDISKDYIVWQIVKERVINYLSKEQNVILDSTMTISKRRKEFIKDLPLCFRYAKIFECDKETAKERIKLDIKNGVDRSNVPDSVVDRMYEQFENDKDKIFEDGFEIM